MSLKVTLSHAALKPLFRLWRDAVGRDMAKQTQVSIAGGLYFQAKGIRATKDIDIVMKSGPSIDRFNIRNKIAKADPRFTVSLEGRCALTYCENPTAEVVSIDIIDEKSLYMPEGMNLDDVVEETTVPLPTDAEAVAMKLISASDRLQSKEDKAVKGFDDVMLLFIQMWKEDGEMTYKNDTEKLLVSIAFNKFYPTYEKVKKERGETYMTEAEFKVFLKMD